MEEQARPFDGAIAPTSPVEDDDLPSWSEYPESGFCNCCRCSGASVEGSASEINGWDLRFALLALAGSAAAKLRKDKLFRDRSDASRSLVEFFRDARW
jgi:hypothetical protein